MSIKNDSFDRIEENFSVESVKVNGFQFWPFIRFKVNEELRTALGIKSRVIKLDSSLVKVFFVSLTYGLRNILRLFRSRYWVFSSSGYRKLLDNKFHDRVVEDIFEILPNAIGLESPVAIGKHYPLKKLPHSRIMSQSLLFLGSYLFTRLVRKMHIENADVLDQIFEKYPVNFDYKHQARLFLGQYRFMKFLLYLHRPKMVFMVYTASSAGYIKALKEVGVTVIEMQHGVINEQHKAYMLKKPLDRNFFPDYLFTYGDNERKYFDKKNYLYPIDKVIPVGYSFIEKMVLRDSPSLFKDYEKDLRKQFDILIAYSFQEPFDDFIISFLTSAARINASIVYLIIPRDLNRVFPSDLPSNVIVEKEINIYEALKICDIHATINSTCALEAFKFGKPTILIDNKNLANLYYGKTFKGFQGVKYINTAQQLANVSLNQFPSSKQIKDEGDLFFKSNFKSNFSAAFQQISKVV